VPKNLGELRSLISEYDGKTPPDLVACPPEFSIDSAVDPEVAVNVNSMSPKVLADLKYCEVKPSVISALLSRNKVETAPKFRNVRELNAFLTAKSLPPINRDNCDGVSLRF
jgi:hypothetical protein